MIITCSIEVRILAICSENPVDVVKMLYAVDDSMTAIAPVERADTVNKEGRSHVSQNGTYLMDIISIPVYIAVASAKMKLIISRVVINHDQNSILIFKYGRMDISLLGRIRKPENILKLDLIR